MPELILERERKEKDNESLLPEIAEILSMSVSELENKPEDIKNMLYFAYLNTSNQQERRKQLLAVISPKYELQRDLSMNNIENNPLKTVEEMVEGSYSFIDGIINNEPPKKQTEELTISREQIKANADMVLKNNTRNNSEAQREI